MGKWVYELTGKPATISAVTNGDHAGGKYSHKNGWKFDLHDGGFNAKDTASLKIENIFDPNFTKRQNQMLQAALDDRLAQLAEKISSVENLSVDDRKLLSGVLKAKLNATGNATAKASDKVTSLQTKLDARIAELPAAFDELAKTDAKFQPHAKPVNCRTAQSISRPENELAQPDDGLMSDLSEEQYAATKATCANQGVERTGCRRTKTQRQTPCERQKSSRRGRRSRA